MAYDHMIIQTNNSPSNMKDYLIEFQTNVIDRNFKDSISYEEVYIDQKENLQGVQVVSETKNFSAKRIIMPPSLTIKTGNIVYRVGEYESTWICTSVDTLELYCRGKIEKSNTELKWVDDNGNIQSFPAIMDSGDASNTAIDVDTIMRIPSGRRQIRTVNNSHTIKIKKDMRFIFGDESFSVADKDPVADVGLITFSFESSEFSQNDNLEIGIADYYNRINPTTIKVIDQNIELKVGQNYPLNIKVFDKNGKVDNPNLMLEYNNSHLLIDKDNNIMPLINSQGTIKIVSNSTELIVNYIISDRETMDYNIVIEGKDNIVTGKIVEYYVKFYNNGQLVDYNSKFRLTDVNDKETKLATIVSQDRDKCTIQANKQVGEILLHVESLNGLFKSSKLIKIKGLF